MKRTTTKEETLRPEYLTSNLFDTGFDKVAIGQALAKVIIGYVYLITGVMAAFEFGVMVALMLTTPGWLAFAIMLAVAIIVSGAVAYTTPYVADAVVEGGIWAVGKAKSLFAGAKSRFAKFEMPQFATKH